ncbi:hypothetical protein [Stenotrophomonas sp. Iso1]|uniref:hypothetical protein n=1 Tax=Stenotrophomonas sp. Iso1 TaxID=2977283 RepID=UPI0022B7AF3D|nr:hypothetical protein [Stenotrophomonas sp. Iso1]
MWIRTVAGMAALAFLSALARLLLQMPEAAPATREARVQLRWLPPAGARPQKVEPLIIPVEATPDPVTPPEQPVQPRPAMTVVTTAMPAATKPSEDLVKNLYGSDGRPEIPDAAGVRQKASAERVFEHRDELATGVGERATANLFSGKNAGTSQSRAQRALYGRDIQAAEARRPPEVAFNPALHERPADLGSEATGDAYKAAPIRFEKVPDMKGEASRRIRAAIGALEGRYPRCGAEQRTRWMAAALTHLNTLQRVEYRYNNGADPTEAEHTLPSAADSAYDLARRALWDAERRMKTCG